MVWKQEKTEEKDEKGQICPFTMDEVPYANTNIQVSLRQDIWTTIYIDLSQRTQEAITKIL